MKIIALSGFRQSGKDTVASMIPGGTKLTQIAFADNIRGVIQTIFPFSINGDSWASDIKEKPIPQLCKYFGRKDISPRWLMDNLGEGMKTVLHPNVWVDSVREYIKTLEKEDKNQVVVLSDVRFKQEIALLSDLKRMGHDVEYWLILKKDTLPEWVKLGLNPAVSWERNIIKKDFETRKPEYDWVSVNPTFDKVIYNDGSLEDLKKNVIAAFNAK